MNSLVDRGRVFVWNLYDLVPTLISLGLWIGVYRYAGHLSSGWSIERLVTYFLLVNVLMLFVSINIENDIYHDHVKNGELATILVKPINYFAYLFCTEHGWKIARLTIALPIVVALLAIFSSYIQITFTFSGVLWFLLFLSLSLMMLFYWKLIVGFFSFWTIENWGLMNFLWMIQALFSGSLFPLNFMGKILGTIASFLPFQYFYYIPLNVLLSETEIKELVTQAAVALFWLFALGRIAGYMYKKGTVRFTDTMQ